jgi:hypothetical protein
MKHVTTDPKSIGQAAQRVAKQHDDFEAAEADELDAYVELLGEVMSAARVSLPAISSNIPGRDLRGVQLLRGENEDVWWLESDELYRVTRDDHGRWSARDIISAYGRHGAVDAILQIAGALDAQLRGGKSQSTHKIRRRADQIRALAVLAKGLS